MVKWYVIQTKPRKETQVENLFSQGGFTVYNPKFRQDGAIRPFFPGYLFLRFKHPEQYRKIIFTRGVKKVIGNELGPVPLEPEIIACLKARERNGFIELMKYGDEPRPGDEIEIMEGPLKGLRGLFCRELSDRQRVMILLNYVAYQASLMIEKNKIKKVCRPDGVVRKKGLA
ncbi:MAG: transcription termination/antitermination protein NusG [Candidatus Saccharicenans sp.]|uniref:transcription termination/antitermination protein NusG n=1 Tax=Candidatus Saccharicenans sp. TaxID=2819258 RepID=UPI004049D742